MFPPAYYRIYDAQLSKDLMLNVVIQFIEYLNQLVKLLFVNFLQCVPSPN
jgi:hypothetical protein